MIGVTLLSVLGLLGMLLDFAAKIITIAAGIYVIKYLQCK